MRLGLPKKKLTPKQFRTNQPQVSLTIDSMDFREMARDPKHRRGFEKLLRLAAARGDDDLVVERLRWGIDPNCTSNRGRTPLIVNVRGSCPNFATVQALLKAGADPTITDESGFCALDYARRKLVRVQSERMRPPSRSPNLDENNQLRLPADEQAELDQMRERLGPDAREYLQIWWKERLRAARRVFNDPVQIEKIVELLEEVVG
jgi:hypothetical protein